MTNSTRLGQLRREIEDLKQSAYEQSRVDPEWAADLREALAEKEAEYRRLKEGDFGSLGGFGDLEADPARDAAFRAAAGRIADRLYTHMSEIAIKPAAMDMVLKQNAISGRLKTGNLSAIGMEEFSFNLLVLPSAPDRRAFFSAPRMLIGLHFLPDDAVAAVERGRGGRKILQKFLAKQFAQHKDSIVHEIIHMFDFMRGNPQFLKAPAYARVSGEQQRVLYVNNPQEFNALYQQGIVAVEQAIRRLSPPNRLAVYQSFDTFMALANRTESIEVMREAIVPEWERKLDARLWQAWQYLAQQQDVAPVAARAKFVRPKMQPKKKKKRKR